MMVAALNPCPCGYRNDPRRDCHCTPPQIEKYMGKISGPLLDRIDIHVEVPAADFNELSSTKLGTSSEQIREEVMNARKAQFERFQDTSVMYNAQMSSPANRFVSSVPWIKTASTSCDPQSTKWVSRLGPTTRFFG